MKESSKKTCPDCWGSGWEIQFRMPCKPCKGSGKVADNAFLVEGKKETPEVHRCNGCGCEILYSPPTNCCDDCWRRVEDVEANEPSKDQEELWISVEERLPEQNILVLVSRLYGGGNRDFRLTYINHHGEFDDLLNNTITHWMPLPEPPKTKL